MIKPNDSVNAGKNAADNVSDKNVLAGQVLSSSATPSNTTPSDNALFAYASMLRHVRSGNMYAVLLGPDLLRLEASAEPAYGYRAVGADGSLTGPLWARSQVEMEDGRFELANEDDSSLTDIASDEDLDDASGPGAPSFSGERSVIMNAMNSMQQMDPRPDLRAMLRLSSSRYEATYESADGQRRCSWDCTGILCSQYTLAEFWEIVEEKNGSFLTNSLREDTNAPDWVRLEEGDDEDAEIGCVTVKALPIVK